MKNKHYILIILLLSTFTSCNDFLDNKPKGYTIPKDFEDYSLMLNAQTLSFMGCNYVIYLTDDAVLGDDDSPEDAAYMIKMEEEKNCYTFKAGDIFPQGTDDDFYTGLYAKIYPYNVVINNIMEVKDASESQKLALKAEALVQRAFGYLQLVNCYAPQYEKSTAAKDYGVPLILTDDVNKAYKRNTVQEVYDRIIADLKEAVDYLPKVAENTYHANKTTAYALLARTYLYMGEYELAYASAKEALKYNVNTLVDYTEYISIEGDYNRVITEDGSAFAKKNKNPQNIFMKLPPDDISSTIYASDDLMQIFSKNLPDGAIDKREELFYAKDAANTWYEMEFPGMTMYIPHILFNVGVTVAELYVTLAECEARIPEGTAQQACAYLDHLRNFRIVNNKPLNLSTKDEALNATLDERRKEFAFVGQMRFIDLRRLNKDERFAKNITHEVSRETFTLPANDARYVMPLPYSVREFNPNIPQLPR